MDIAALSMNLGSMKTMNAISVSVLKKTMDVYQNSAQQLTDQMMANAKAMERSVNPNVGRNIDIRI